VKPALRLAAERAEVPTTAAVSGGGIFMGSETESSAAGAPCPVSVDSKLRMELMKTVARQR
jgi:hypothetical protein